MSQPVPATSVLPLASLACPSCRSALVHQDHGLACTGCGARYPVSDGVPHLLAREDAGDDADPVAHLYEHVAHQYDRVFAPHVVEHYLARRAGLVKGLLPAGDVLDVGCGTGMLGARLSGMGYRVAGVDLSPAMLAEARRRGLVEVYAALSTRLPFRDGTFDLAITVATLHHLETVERVAATVSEMARVVRRGGYVVLWDHNPLNPYWPFLMRRVPQDTGEERLVPMEELLADVKVAGLEVISARRMGLVPDFLPALLLAPWRLVERAVETVPVVRRWAAHNVVVARKP